MSDAPELNIFVDGQWSRPPTSQWRDVFNPSSGRVIARVPMCTAQEVDRAADAATKAFCHWSRMPAPQRSAVLFNYRHILQARQEELTRLVTRENGKTLDEARGDVKRGLEVVEFACGVAHLGKGETLPRMADQLDGVTMREPIGVCVGITPFNFPAMVPMWMYPLAIACGNTFILKPSEKVPLTAIRLTELFEEAGLPQGVLNIVHGGREVVDALCTHPQVAAVSFVGSSPVARHVYALGCAHGKRVQAAGGAKNVMVVMPDADPDSAVRGILGAAYGCAGQRCMAGSLLMGVADAGDGITRRVAEAIDGLKLGNTDRDPGVHMGPVIDPEARDRVWRYIEMGLSEGAVLVRDGRTAAHDEGFFVGPTLFDHATRDMRITTDEIFGPLLTQLRPRSLAEAIDWANHSGYGNGATIFTTSGRHARDFTQGIHCGMVGVNVSVPAPMAVFAFSGWKGSFFGDLHVQGTEGILFYTRQKVVLSRWDGDSVRQQGW